MKRTILILLLLLPLTLMSQSKLYRQYAKQADLKVAQLDGFKLSESVRIDVVMLHAETDDAWQRLKNEFDIRGDEGSVSWLGQVDTPAVRARWDGEPVMRVIASHRHRTVAFYLIETEAQYDALVDYQIKKTKEKK